MMLRRHHGAELMRALRPVRERKFHLYWIVLDRLRTRRGAGNQEACDAIQKEGSENDETTPTPRARDEG